MSPRTEILATPLLTPPPPIIGSRKPHALYSNLKSTKFKLSFTIDLAFDRLVPQNEDQWMAEIVGGWQNNRNQCLLYHLQILQIFCKFYYQILYKTFQRFSISSRNLPKFYLIFFACFINILKAFTKYTKEMF